MKLLIPESYVYSPEINTFPIECIFCKKTFFASKNLVRQVIKNKNIDPLNERSNRLKFCNQNCCNNFHKKEKEVLCKECEKTFFKKESQIKKSPNNFCSSSCSAKYNNKHKTKGTRRSKLEIWIESQLKILYPDLKIEYNQKTLKTELDIYIPLLKIAFEINGLFHYKSIYGSKKLDQIQKNDLEKSKICSDLGIELIVIDSSMQTIFTEKTSLIYLNNICNHINFHKMIL